MAVTRRFTIEGKRPGVTIHAGGRIIPSDPRGGYPLTEEQYNDLVLRGFTLRPVLEVVPEPSAAPSEAASATETAKAAVLEAAADEVGARRVLRDARREAGAAEVALKAAEAEAADRLAGQKVAAEANAAEVAALPTKADALEPSDPGRPENWR